jgi:hypothetical protein
MKQSTMQLYAKMGRVRGHRNKFLTEEAVS